jgi:hypothetical protein
MWLDRVRVLWAWLIRYLNSGGAQDIRITMPEQLAPPRDFPSSTKLVLIRPSRAMTDQAAEVDFDLMAMNISDLLEGGTATVVCFASDSQVYARTAANLSNRLNGHLEMQIWSQAGELTAMRLLQALAVTQTAGPVVIVMWQPGIVSLLRESYILHPALKYLGMDSESEDMPLTPIPLSLEYHQATGASLREGW